MDGRMNRMLYRGTFYRDASTVSGSDSGGCGVSGGSGCGFGVMKRAMGKGGGREKG